MNLDPETDLHFTRIIDVPRSIIWQCWTQPEHIAQFFVPQPHRIVDCQIDLRVGGRFNTSMEVEGNRADNKGVYLEVMPEEKLVFTDTYTEGWKPAADPFMTAILLLEDAENGATKYTAIARHRSAETREAHENMGFYGGWGTVAEQMADYAKANLL